MNKKALVTCITLLVLLVPFSLMARPQGELKVARPSLHTENFDPSELGSILEFASTNEMLTKVVDTDGRGKMGYAPVLAERVEVSEDGLTYDFYLRKGVQFHGGWGEVTAEDIIYTIGFLGREGSHFPHNDLWLPPEKHGMCDSYEAVSKYHFRHKLVKPYTWLLKTYSTNVFIISKNYYESVGVEKALRHPIGTGPWKFKSIKAGEYVKYEAVNNHYRKTPEFKYLTVKVVPEESTRIAMLRTGELDIGEITPSRKREVERAGLQIKIMPAIGAFLLNFGGQFGVDNPNYDPTSPWAWHQDEPMWSTWNRNATKIRKAMCMAINRPAIISKIFKNEAKASAMFGWDPDAPDYRSDWAPLPYDPEGAKKLLAEAGYPNGFSKPVNFYLYESTFGVGGRKVGMAAANDLEAIGIKLDRVELDEWGFIEKWSMRNENAWSIAVGAGYTSPAAVWQLQYIYLKKGFFNDGGFRHDDFDPLYEAAMSAVDYDEQIRTAWAVGDYVIGNSLGCPIALPHWLVAVSSKVGPVDQWDHNWKATSIGQFEYVPRR